MMGTIGPLEQFTLAAQSASGDGCANVVYQAIDAPGVYVFSELLELPSVQALAGTHAAHMELLRIFAYGTIADYNARIGTLPQLTKTQHTKLQHLTIVSLATRNKDIPYALLMSELGIASVRELEDVVISGIYADVFQAALDPQEQKVHIEYAIGRDVRPGQVEEMIQILERWDATQRALLSALQERIQSADQAAQGKVAARADIEALVQSLQNSLASKEKGGDPRLQPRAGPWGLVEDSDEIRRKAAKQVRHSRK